MDKKEKDWRERIKELISGYFLYGSMNILKIEEIIEQEIDRAREEQNKKIEDVINEELKQGNIVILKKNEWFKKLSNLKNKSNG